MQCSQVTDYLLERDTQEALPERVRRHLRGCDSCSRVAATLFRAERTLFVQPPNGVMTAEHELSVERVMTQVRAEPEDPNTAVRLLSWLAGGILLIISAAGFRFTETFQSLARTQLGSSVDLALTLATGIILTMYVSLFALGNSHRLRRLLRLRG